MNHRRPFVLLPFPQRRQEHVSDRDATSTNGRIVRAKLRPVVKRDRAVRFFQDVHGVVHRGGLGASHYVACAAGQGLPADYMVR